MLEFMARGVSNYIQWHLQPDESCKQQFLRNFAQLCLAERAEEESMGSGGADASGVESVASDVQSVDDVADAILDKSARPEGIGAEQWRLAVKKGREVAGAKKAARLAQRSKGFGGSLLKVKQ